MNHRKNKTKRDSKRAAKRLGTTWGFHRAFLLNKTRKADLRDAANEAKDRS